MQENAPELLEVASPKVPLDVLCRILRGVLRPEGAELADYDPVAADFVNMDEDMDDFEGDYWGRGRPS